MSKEGKPVKGRVFPTILPEIRSLIEISRHHAAITANLALVNLYWNIGRIITQDIQKNEKRAGYGEQLLDSLATSLAQEYGRGYSVSNLNDMRRFRRRERVTQHRRLALDVCRVVREGRRRRGDRRKDDLADGGDDEQRRDQEEDVASAAARLARED